MIILRPYQIEGVDNCSIGFKKFKRQILTAPTGAGKTVMFSEIVKRAYERGTNTLVLTNRIELFNQTFKSLSITGIPIQKIYSDNKNISDLAVINVAMVETLIKRISKGLVLNPKLIIIDECHIASFNKIIDLFEDSLVLGCSATPEGKHIFKYYENIISTLDIPDLVEQGFLVDCKAYQMQDDFSDLEIKAGEYTDQSLLNHFDKPKLYDGVIEEWKKHANGLKTLIFCINIKHTISTYYAFVNAGISCEYLTSKTISEDRKRILAAYKSGSFLVLINCGILTTGYDEPSIQCVVMNRATKSLPLFLQCAGRGSRLYPNKEHFILLDFGMNHDRHGMWNEDRNWKLKPPKTKKESVAPVKECGNSECGCLVAASTMVCKYCGYIFPVKESEISSGVMVEVTTKIPSQFEGMRISDLSVHDLLELEKSKKYKSSFIWRVICSHGEEAVLIYAKIKGYKNGW
ncbi:MAG: DEAD/DEAH box helicase, partial [Oligoflexus sp.]|nr:DEAD/DEAH box helicase [Pseudopedobacter sp.]